MLAVLMGSPLSGVGRLLCGDILFFIWYIVKFQIRYLR